MSDGTDNWREEVAALLGRGDKIGAIKVYREHTGVDLVAAKTFVEELQRTLKSGVLPGGVQGDLESDLLSQLRAGQKIDAIKRYREATGVGLKDAKEAVEALAAKHGVPGGSRSGCLGVILAVGAVLAIFWFAALPGMKAFERKAPLPDRPQPEPQQHPMENAMTPAGREVATLAGGCFWCLEAVFEQLEGVDKVVSGYTGGHVANPTYEMVCSKTTGHAEVVQVTFDPQVISYPDLLDVFFATHDPTTLNRQGHDVGPQYRSAIYTHSPEQQEAAEAKLRELSAADIFPGPIVTEVAPLTEFFSAEGYHQGYFSANPQQPYCAAVVSPKVAKFRKKFAHRLKN